MQSEKTVNCSLRKIIAEGSPLTAESVIALVKWFESSGISPVVETTVADVDLRGYDNLLDFGEVAVL